MAHVILLVDDSPTVLAVLSNGLREAGYLVATARTAAEALQRVHHLGKIDLLASDIVLPHEGHPDGAKPQTTDTSGLDLMHALVRSQAGLKVILFSGQPEQKIESLGGVPPGTVFLRKPFSSDELERAVAHVLSAP